MSNTESVSKKASHPKSFWLICMTILWERFSYYGLTALLVLFFTASVAQGGLGLSTQEATSMFGLFTGLIYLTPLIGGWLADKVLGQQKCISIGALLIAIGDFVLFASSTSISMVWVGLSIIILGNGFFKSSCSNIVGDIYPKTEVSKKDAAYSLFYMAVNVGAFIAPIICGLLSDNVFAVRGVNGDIVSYGYKMAFLVCGIGMMLGMIIFTLLAPKLLKEVGKHPVTKGTKGEKIEYGPLTKLEKNRIIAMVVLFLFVVLFWTAYYQTQSSFMIYVRDNVNRTLFGFEMPVAWLTSLNAILCVALCPVLAALWVKLSNTKRGDFSIPVKMGLGMIIMGLGFIVMVLATLANGSDGTIKASILFIVVTYIFTTVGELFLSPIGLAMFNKLAPAKYATLSMGAWYLTSFFASLLSGKIAGFTATLGFLQIFGGIAGVLIIFGLILLGLRHMLTKLMAMDLLTETK